MKKQNVNITDASGGYNDLVSPAGLQANEMAVLENYYTDNQGILFKKRLGTELIQHAPVGAFPFTVDAYTLGLWHLDDAVPSPGTETRYPGSTLPVTTHFVSANPGRNLNLYGGLDYPSNPAILPVNTGAPNALFPDTAPIGKSLGQLTPTFTGPDLTGLQSGSVMANGGSWGLVPGPTPLHNQLKVTFETWINIPASYTSQPIITQGFLDTNGTPAPIDDPELTDIPILATMPGNIKNLNDFQYYPGKGVINGLSICHSGTAANGYTGKPFIKFTLNTLGSPSPLVLQTGDLPTGTWLHVKGDYSSTNGQVRLVLNGAIAAQGTMVGHVKDISKFLVSGGKLCYLDASNANNPNEGIPYYATFPGYLDEMRLSLTTYALGAGGGTPFRLPEGQGFEFSKSDGTKQAVIAAEGYLYYTIGDGKWIEIGSGFSPGAYWDAVFYHDILYLSNGVDIPKAWDGTTLVDWGAPNIAPMLLLDGPGDVDNGVHKFAYSYVYDDYETALSPPASITVTGKSQVNVYGIPGRHNNCTAVRVYATASGGSTWYLVREIAYIPGVPVELRGPGVVNGSYSTDTGCYNLKDSNLNDAGHPTIEADVLAAQSPRPKYLVAAHDRLFVCGMSEEPYTLRWSELGTPDVFNALGFARAATNKGPLIALAEYYGEIHASKDGNATLVLRGDSPSSWSLFETLHPTIGCVDHWGYVHRYLVNEDRYTLCFPAKDGFYEYAGQQIRKISDRIKSTTDQLSLSNFTRSAWSIDNTNQFLSTIQPGVGGSSTVNVRQPAYETDGIVQVPEQMGIVDQLNYIGLWNGNSPALVPGNIIALCKAQGEGCFYFSTDADNQLYYTSDNFVTKQSSPPSGTTPIPTNQRIIEITRRGTDNFYFLLTDSASGTDQSSAGGAIYAYDGVSNTVGLVNNTPLFYDLDVPYVMQAGFRQTGITGADSTPTGAHYYKDVWSIGIGTSFFATSSVPSKNLFLNHKQKVLFTYGVTSNYNLPQNQAPFKLKYSSCASVSGDGVGPESYFWAICYGGNTTDSTRLELSPGYFSFKAPGTLDDRNFSSQSYAQNFMFNIKYTRREFPAWRGGTFRPNSFWDATNNKLVFLASGAEDAYGNRFSSINTLSGATLTKITRPWSVGSLATDGPRAYWTEIAYDSNAARYSTIGNSIAVVHASLSNLASITTNLLNKDTSPYRIVIDQTNANLLVAHKKFNTANNQEFYSYASWTSDSLLAGGALIGSFSDILKLGSDADSGPILKEFSKQTDTPFALYGIVDRPTNAAIYSFKGNPGALLAADIYEANTYSSPFAGVPTTGILSNALFVPASGPSGGNLWSDRMYWMAQANAMPMAQSSSDITSSYTFNPSLPLVNQSGNLLTAPQTTGKIVVNGVTIEWNSGTQSLADILAAISGSAPNVHAYWDAPNFKVNIESLVPSQLTIAESSGNLLAVMKITAGTYGLGAPTSNGRLVQLGVPGVWTVIGKVECEYHNLGIFSSFDTFSSVLRTQGDANKIDFYLRNASDTGPLGTADYYSQENNRPILSFSPPLPYVQWKAIFTWDYNYQTPNSYPFLASVAIGYLTGQIQNTRIIGAHYNNRTYWAVSTQNSPTNNLVLVYQKNSTWTKVTNWDMSSMFLFRNMFVGFDNYNFLHLESGASDNGALIPGRARTGQMLGTVDKMISRAQVNLSTFNDTLQPAAGYVKIVPIQGETALTDAAWSVQIPNSLPLEPQRIQGNPVNGFKYPWSRSFAIEIMSDLDNANPNQLEEIQSVDLVIDITGDTYDLPVK